MSDRELLEKAAKAAGLMFIEEDPEQPVEGGGLLMVNWTCWNPLTHGGQALLLAMKLGLIFGFDDRFAKLGPCTYCTYPTGPASCDSIMQSIAEAGGKEAATFRAIVRAAAAMSEVMS